MKTVMKTVIKGTNDQTNCFTDNQVPIPLA